MAPGVDQDSEQLGPVVVLRQQEIDDLCLGVVQRGQVALLGIQQDLGVRMSSTGVNTSEVTSSFASRIRMATKRLNQA